MSAAVPESMPCGHPTAESLLECDDDTRRLTTLPASVDPWGREASAAAVWCVPCFAWHDVTPEQLPVYRAVQR